MSHTIGSILQISEDWLAQRNVDSPKVDAGFLLAHALGLPRLQLYLQTERPLSEDELAVFRPLLQRRGKREPVSKIVGLKGFWNHDFEVTQAVLSPRSDSEILIETALALELGDDANVIDLCTGSACLAVSLAAEKPTWHLVATDCSAEALEVAARNLKRCDVEERIELLCGDLFAGAEGCFDLIISNPPYIAEFERESLDPEVLLHDPAIALFSGADGLDLMRRVVKEAPPRLKERGWLLLEHGCDQAPAVAELMGAHGFVDVVCKRDLAGRERATLGRLPSVD
ncbi:MAG: peptide chain release factor N(5)-glutamine methyltransferase [Myxococcota bacterium]|nr:peptide chain release factor N(5)-glutamine methyltransferase [Myxococcota bacterium]